MMFAFEVTDQVEAQKAPRAARGRGRGWPRRASASWSTTCPTSPGPRPPRGAIDFFNRRWYEYTGTSPEELDRAGTIALEDPDTIVAVRARWAKGIASGEAFELEFPLRGRDGVFRWFLTRLRPAARRQREDHPVDRDQHRHRRPQARRELPRDHPRHPRSRSAQPAQRHPHHCAPDGQAGSGQGDERGAGGAHRPQRRADAPDDRAAPRSHPARASLAASR